MQDVIEEVIRWLGYAALRLLTVGRYRGGGDQDRVAEGAVGLAVVVGATYVCYVLIGT